MTLKAKNDLANAPDHQMGEMIHSGKNFAIFVMQQVGIVPFNTHTSFLAAQI